MADWAVHHNKYHKADFYLNCKYRDVRGKNVLINASYHVCGGP